MKLAIFGSSALALETALRFHFHGAAVSWFAMPEEDWEREAELNGVTFKEFTSDLGRSWLKGNDFPSPEMSEAFDYHRYQEEYFKPLVAMISADHKVRPYQVVSVTKRFLGPEETLPNKSRFYDLFRVIYEVNPQDFIQEQKETNPETYKRLSEEFLTSLQSNLEMYEDFDLVIDARKKLAPRSLAASGRALGEKRISNEFMGYGAEALKMTKSITLDSEIREVALIGENTLSAQVILKMTTWLKDPRTRLFIISEKENPFEQFFETGISGLVDSIRHVFKSFEDEFEKQITDFHHKLREWQNLDDFVQVKMPIPVEPIPRLVFFSGHNVTAVDQLVDKHRLFLTIEKPDFRNGKKHPENNNLDLKTIGIDRILVTDGPSHAPLDLSIQKDEVGFFALMPTSLDLKLAWEKDLNRLKGIENEIFKLFSPAHSH